MRGIAVKYIVGSGNWNIVNIQSNIVKNSKEMTNTFVFDRHSHYDLL